MFRNHEHQLMIENSNLVEKILEIIENLPTSTDIDTWVATDPIFKQCYRILDKAGKRGARRTRKYIATINPVFFTQSVDNSNHQAA